MKLLIVVGLLSLHVTLLVHGEPFTDVIADQLLKVVSDASNHQAPSSLPYKKERYLPPEQRVIEHPEVSTTSGIVVGSTLPEAHAFYSIPYGVAPVGELRFEPPQPFTSTEELNVSVPNYVGCFEFSLDCRDPDGCGKNYSEDCLVLNVNVPSTVDLSSPPNERLPVMFWLHGGGFFFGAGTLAMYDGRWLANSTNTIIVSVNYRLDALGFLNYEENGESIDGNQGFKDQQLALQWVQDNIEQFGGDKNKVTIFGQSAGAQSVMLHLVSDKSDQLFKRAIMQSNPAAFYYPTKEEARSITEALLGAISCTGSGLQCLRDAPASTLMKAHSRVMASEVSNFFNVIEPYRPILDGIDFSEQPLELYQSGRWQNHKEVIIGITSEEVAALNVIFENITIGQTLLQALTSFVVGPQFAPAVVEEYMKLAPPFPGPRFDYTDIFVQEVSDMVFVCPSRALARFMSTTASNINPSPTYLYVYSYPLSGPNCEDITNNCGYAFHGSDTFFVFNAGENTGYIFGENDTAVAKIFSDFWGHFAHFGKPSEGLTAWPPYISSDLNSGINPWTNVRIQAPETFIENGYRNDLCDFWDSLNFYVNFTASTESPTSSQKTEDTTMLTEDTTKSDTEEIMTTTDGSATFLFPKPVITFAISIVAIIGANII